MAFKMSGWSAFTKKNKKIDKLEEVEDQLHGAVKAHRKQAEIVGDHIDDLKDGKGFPKKKGDKGSWMYGGKEYFGTFIREDEEAEYYRTHNNKIKRKLKK